MPAVPPVVKTGQIWKENDPRRKPGDERYVYIINVLPHRVKVRRTNLDGTTYQGARERSTWRYRFDGRHTGYSLAKDVL